MGTQRSCIGTCALVLSCLWLLPSLCTAKGRQRQRDQRLNFREGPPGYSTFKIVQITDIHLGEPYAEINDPKTFQSLRTILSIETPDLIVVSGDFLTSDMIQDHADAYLHQLAAELEPFDTPWAILFGNHDVAYYRYDYTAYRPARVRRTPLARADQSHALSLTQVGPRGVFGASNYWLDVYDSNDQTVASRILLLDTGGGMIPRKLDASQVDWFHRTNDPNVATFCFQHLPTATMQWSSDTSKCRGETLYGAIDPIPEDAGMTRAMQDAGNVGFVAVGHNHGNSFCCSFDDSETEGAAAKGSMHYCFGRHSGYGGAAAFTEHGVRVYELHRNHANGHVHWSSYVRTEHGRVTDAYQP